ncbi:MAG: alpha/beta fold hydrolase [Epulopiscium sp.]|nr:alpha/beta fold hydrolase [Candidatus Epulonipiscium sp.]
MKSNHKKRWSLFLLPIFFITLYNRWIFWKVDKTRKTYPKTASFFSWKWGNIYYTVEGSGKPLLLIHGIGTGSSSLEWKQNVKEWSKKYRVYRIDLLGFGFSDKPKMTYTAFLYVQLLRDFIQEVIQEPTHVIAHSLSCSFTTMTCHQYPHLFKKIIFICPIGINKDAPYPTLKKQWIKKIMESPIIGTLLYNCITSRYGCKYFLQNYAYYHPKNVTQDIIRNHYHSAHIGGPKARYALASFIGNFMNIDASSAFKNLSHEILVMNKKRKPSIITKQCTDFLK